MGAIQSRQRYREVAYEAFENARELQYEIGGPRVWGAILAYIDGRINAQRLTRVCTQIEANEFARLASSVYQEWINRHEQHFRCDAGRRGICRYPRDNLHFQDCGYYQSLPLDIQFPPEPDVQDHDHALRGQDDGAQYYDCEFADGYDETFDVRHSRNYLFDSGHEDELENHHEHAFHNEASNEYDAGHLNFRRCYAELPIGEHLTARGGPRAPAHRHPQIPSYIDNLTDEYDSSSENSVAYDSSYLHSHNEDFSGDNGRSPSTFGRPLSPTTINYCSGGTIIEPLSRPNVDHRHGSRYSAFASSATDSQDDHLRTRGPIYGRREAGVRVSTTRGRGERRGVAARWEGYREDSARTGAALGAGQGRAQARGSQFGGRGGRVHPRGTRRADRVPAARCRAEPASSDVNTATRVGNRGQRNARPGGSTSKPRRRTHARNNTGRSEDAAEDAAVAAMNREFGAMGFAATSS